MPSLLPSSLPFVLHSVLGPVPNLPIALVVQGPGSYPFLTLAHP